MRLFVLIMMLALGLAALSQTTPQGPPQQQNGPMQGEGQRRPGVGGTITAITGDSLTLKTFDERTVTVMLTPETRFRKDRQEAKLSDFKVGDMVMVRGESIGENTYKAAAVMTRSGTAMAGGISPEQMREKMGKEIIAGEVKSIDGLNLTIARPDGQTQTVAVDEGTSFRKDGESVTLADLKPGDHVFGRGQLKGGVFVPSVLNIGQPGGMHGSGPGGPPPQGPPQGAPPDQKQ